MLELMDHECVAFLGEKSNENTRESRERFRKMRRGDRVPLAERETSEQTRG